MIDFNTAKQFRQAPDLEGEEFKLNAPLNCKTTLQTKTGFLPFRAPELVDSSQGVRYTQSVDIWSAGACLYYMLSGVSPFLKASTPLMCDAILKAAYDPIEGV